MQSASLRTVVRRLRLPLALIVTTALGRAVPADTVTLKTGIAYQGIVDKDNTLLTIFDGQRRVVVRDTKVSGIRSEAMASEEKYRIDQPLVVHAGEMPVAVVGVRASAWNDNGRRTYEYIGAGSSRPVRMTQAINELGPKQTQIRGVDGYWRSVISTSEIPRPVVIGLLRRFDQTDQAERLKIGRFLIQAEWYPEALAELEGIARDFPDLGGTVANVAASVRALDAERIWNDAQRRRQAGQLQAVQDRLATFPTRDVPADRLEAVRQQLQADEAQAASDRALAQEIRGTAGKLSETRQAELRPALLELLGELEAAPDALRARFEPFRASDPADGPETAFAQALSGWILGPDQARDDLEGAVALWEARRQLLAYLGGRDESSRNVALDALRALRIPAPDMPVDPGLLARIARLAPPPLRNEQDEQPGQARRLRVRDDDSPEPTEYVAVLPPEYHHARRYPALVLLHGGEGPEAAAAGWTAEAAARGVILIAPEYNLRGQPRDYRYTESEHAAVELALRDARKRFAVDSDRVYLAGTLLGGNMAWDFGLAHPDLFAGVAVISGLPAKYVWAYRDNAELVPLYFAMGDLAPAEPDVIFPLGTSLISRNYDIVYTEYYSRGLEPFPEEIPRVYDWMAPRRREPYRKEFTAATARDCDSRFFGVVARSIAADRARPPEQVEPLGKNLKPATMTRTDRTLANLLDLETSGLERVDLWLGPPYLDVNQRLEIRINGKTAFRGRVPVDMGPFLEDLRQRGDREQLYWVRYSADLARSRR